MDGHDRGVKIVALGLADAGMEVIYTGTFQTVETIVETALEESVDVIGISSLSGGHLAIFTQITGLLKKAGRERHYADSRGNHTTG